LSSFEKDQFGVFVAQKLAQEMGGEMKVIIKFYSLFTYGFVDSKLSIWI
jgi:hypothetical protein